MRGKRTADAYNAKVRIPERVNQPGGWGDPHRIVVDTVSTWKPLRTLLVPRELQERIDAYRSIPSLYK